MRCAGAVAPATIGEGIEPERGDTFCALLANSQAKFDSFGVLISIPLPNKTAGAAIPFKNKNRSVPMLALHISGWDCIRRNGNS